MLVRADPRSKSATRPEREPRVAGSPPGSIVTWYMGLTPHWTSASPRVKGRLLLRAHEWIVDRVLAPEVGLVAAAADLRPDGALTRALLACVPPGETERWRHFIHLIVANLRHALLRPVTRRNEAWVRWLFLIPYSIKHAPESTPAAPEDRSARAPSTAPSGSGV